MVSFSINATLPPSWEALIAAEYPPGPPPTTTTSKESSLIIGDSEYFEDFTLLVTQTNREVSSARKGNSSPFLPETEFLLLVDPLMNARLLFDRNDILV